MTKMTKDELLEAAWGIIANAYGGDWDQAENPNWKPAAKRWRDNYHELRTTPSDTIETLLASLKTPPDAD